MSARYAIKDNCFYFFVALLKMPKQKPYVNAGALLEKDRGLY